MSPSRPDGNPPEGVFVDANLLVLLVAGALDPGVIARHRRLRTFGPEDFERLQEMVSGFERVLVTPNTCRGTRHSSPWTSTSTLPRRGRIRPQPSTTAIIKSGTLDPTDSNRTSQTL